MTNNPIIHSEPYYLYPKRAYVASHLEKFAGELSYYAWKFHLLTGCHPLSSKLRRVILYRFLRFIRNVSEALNYGNEKGNHIVGFNAKEMFAVTSEGYHATLIKGIDENGNMVISDQWGPRVFDGITIPVKGD